MMLKVCLHHEDHHDIELFLSQSCTLPVLTGQSSAYPFILWASVITTEHNSVIYNPSYCKMDQRLQPIFSDYSWSITSQCDKLCVQYDMNPLILHGSNRSQDHVKNRIQYNNSWKYAKSYFYTNHLQLIYDTKYNITMPAGALFINII